MGLNLHSLNKPFFQLSFPGPDPLGVVLLRGADTRMPQKPGYIFKTKAPQQRPDSEGVTQSMRPTVFYSGTFTDQLHLNPDLHPQRRAVGTITPERFGFREPVAVVNGPLQVAGQEGFDVACGLFLSQFGLQVAVDPETRITLLDQGRIEPNCIANTHPCFEHQSDKQIKSCRLGGVTTPSNLRPLGRLSSFPQNRIDLFIAVRGFLFRHSVVGSDLHGKRTLDPLTPMRHGQKTFQFASRGVLGAVLDIAHPFELEIFQEVCLQLPHELNTMKGAVLLQIAKQNIVTVQGVCIEFVLTGGHELLRSFGNRDAVSNLIFALVGHGLQHRLGSSEFVGATGLPRNLTGGCRSHHPDRAVAVHVRSLLAGREFEPVDLARAGMTPVECQGSALGHDSEYHVTYTAVQKLVSDCNYSHHKAASIFSLTSIASLSYRLHDVRGAVEGHQNRLSVQDRYKVDPILNERSVRLLTGSRSPQPVTNGSHSETPHRSLRTGL